MSDNLYTVQLGIDATMMESGADQGVAQIDRVEKKHKSYTMGVSAAERRLAAERLEQFSRVEAALVRHTDRIEREFRANAAAIKDSLARGFITPAEAERAGRAAAEAYNRGMTRGIDFATRQGIINYTPGGGFADARSSQVYAELAGSLKTVDVAGRSARITLNSLRSSLTSVVASFLSAAPGVTQFSSALGALALGSGVMLAVLGALAALAFAWNKIAGAAREAREESERTSRSITNAWMNAQTQGDFSAIQEQKKAGADADQAWRKYQRAKDAAENREYLDKLYKDALDKQTTYERASQLLTDRRTDRQKEAHERSTRELERQLDERYRLELEHAKKVRELDEYIAGIRVDLTSGYQRDPAGGAQRIREIISKALNVMPPAVTSEINTLQWMGFNTEWMDDLRINVDDTAAALKRFAQEIEEAKERVGATGTPSGGPAADPGFFDKVYGNVAKILNPETIASNVIGNLVTGGLNSVLGAVGNFVDGLFNNGKRAREAARLLQQAQMEFTNRLADMISTLPSEFISGRGTVEDLVEDWRKKFTNTRDPFNLRTIDIGYFDEDGNIRQSIEAVDSFEDLVKVLEMIRSSGAYSGEALERLNEIIEYTKQQAERYNKVLEEQAEAQRKAAASIEDTVLAGEARRRGDIAASMQILGEADIARQLAAAQELVDAGFLSQEMFERLADVLRGDLADSIAAAVEAVEKAKRALVDDLTLAGLIQSGDERGAEEFQAKQRAQQWREQATAAGFGAGDPIWDKIQAWLDTELANIAKRFSATATETVADTASTGISRVQAISRSVVGITHVDAVNLVDIGRTQLTYTSYLPKIYEAIVNGGLTRTSAGGFGGGMHFHFHGPVNTISPTTLRLWAREMATYMDVALGELTNDHKLGSGDMSL